MNTLLQALVPILTALVGTGLGWLGHHKFGTPAERAIVSAIEAALPEWSAADLAAVGAVTLPSLQ